MSETIIKTEGLSKRYGGITAVDKLFLEIRKGEVFGLLGPNGAGKTTTTLMLLGLTEPSGGRAQICGYDCTRDSLQVKKITGYLPDNVGFYPDMTGRQNLRFTGRLNGLQGEERDADGQRQIQLGDELLADGEGLRQAVRTRLLCVGEVHAVARAVPEQALEVGQVGRRGDDQDVPDARQHEGGQRVVDHGLVVDRQQLLGGHERERVQARAGPAGEDDAFHSITSKVSERKNKSV